MESQTDINPNTMPEEGIGQFQIHKLYIKSSKFESPAPHKIFSQEWSPELNVEIDTESTPLAEANTYEVVLSAKCKVESNNQLAFELEVKQAGIFTINELPDDRLEEALLAFCPTVLYPYLRESIADLVIKAGFPQLNLAPINFEVMYQQRQQQEINAMEHTSESEQAAAHADDTTRH